MWCINLRRNLSLQMPCLNCTVGTLKVLRVLTPNWPLLTLKKVDKAFTPGASPQTIEMVAKNGDKFINSHGVVHQVLDDKSTVPYIPTHQQIDTILQYHQKLGHTRAHHLTKYIKQRC